MNRARLPERLNRTLIYGSDWINLFIDRVRLPSGKIIERYHQLDYPRPSVAVVVMNAQGAILMIHSARYTTGRLEWEIPAGRVEPGEDPAHAAQREVLEETGCAVHDLRLIYTYNPANGMSNQVVYAFVTQVADAAAGAMDTDEVVATRWFAPGDIRRMIAANEIHDGISLLPLLLVLSK